MPKIFHGDLLSENLNQVQTKNPLILNLTNQVVSNFTANCLLAIGASPLMAQDQSEVEELIALSDALSINIGTLDENQIKSIMLAVSFANKKEIPIVIDPVGAGASNLRRSATGQILKAAKRAILKGNASEIISLSGKIETSKGVDSLANPSSAIGSAKELLASENLEIIMITGEEDFIVSKKEILKCSNGHKLMSKVTGTGCALGSVITAFLSSNEDPLTATLSAISYFNIAGELAASQCLGPGSFIPAFLDNLYGLKNKKFNDLIRIENVK